MDAVLVRECGCGVCQQGEDANVLAEHRRINVLLSRLDEQQRRWFVAHESQRLGFGGDVRMSQVTGLNVDTIARGRAELSQDLADRPTDRVRVPWAGRPSVEKRSDTDDRPATRGRTGNGGIAHRRLDEVGAAQSAEVGRTTRRTRLSQCAAASVAEGRLWVASQPQTTQREVAS